MGRDGKRMEKSLENDESVDVEIKFSYDGDSEVPKKIFGSYKIDSGKPEKFNFLN